MSSNPFRRKPPAQLPLDDGTTAAPGAAFEDAVNQALEGKGRKQSASKKTVRIQTPPPLSPDPVTTSFGSPLIRRLSNEPRAGSPPPALPADVPPAAAALKLDPLGPSFGADVAPQDPQVIINTRRNSETGVSESASPEIASSPPTALAAKVLNPFQRTLANIEPQEDRPDDTAKTTGEGSAGAIDVNSFTKMLMTGQGGPTPAELSKKSAAEGQTKASAQTASVPHDFDELEDASSSEDGSPRAPRREQGGRGAPPPPKHKHGKSINERAPQTVSFNDFEDDAGSARADRTPADEPPRKTSDPEQSKRRLPPPPPLSRRPPSTTFETAGGANAPLPSPGVSTGAKSGKAPPPPPTRRGANRNSYQPDMQDRNSENANLGDEMFDSGTARRAANNDQKPSSRSSSVSEQRNPGAPPPPPTRRRRGSSKSSVENQPTASSRTASEARRAVDENRRGSQDSVRKAGALGQVEEDRDDSGAGAASGDILADLSAFQAEVDALRSSYRKS